MGLQKEIWQDHIAGNLFKNNEFLLASTDAGQYVLQGKVVHIPQAGAVATVVKNRSAVPATVVLRGDTDVTYSLDEFSTNPILIPDAENYELSYNKRESILAEHELSLREALANNLLVTWSPDAATGLVLRTSGTSVTSHLDGTLGNRKKLTVNDLKHAQLQLNKQNIPMEGRYALLSADMFQQLTDDMTATQYRDFSAAYDVQNGIVGRLFGFNIMMRGTVVTYNNSALPEVRPEDAEAEATDNDAVLCWHVTAVERALGQIKFFERVGDPTFYGDVYSACVRMGGRKRRSDAKGIVAIVQQAA
jgi:hypothetical protein